MNRHKFREEAMALWEATKPSSQDEMPTSTDQLVDTKCLAAQARGMLQMISLFDLHCTEADEVERSI